MAQLISDKPIDETYGEKAFDLSLEIYASAFAYAIRAKNEEVAWIISRKFETLLKEFRDKVGKRKSLEKFMENFGK